MRYGIVMFFLLVMAYRQSAGRQPAVGTGVGSRQSQPWPGSIASVPTPDCLLPSRLPTARSPDCRVRYRREHRREPRHAVQPRHVRRRHPAKRGVLPVKADPPAPQPDEERMDDEMRPFYRDGRALLQKREALRSKSGLLPDLLEGPLPGLLAGLEVARHSGPFTPIGAHPVTAPQDQHLFVPHQKNGDDMDGAAPLRRPPPRPP